MLAQLRRLLNRRRLVLDPFAGTGLIHQVHDRAIGVEIEPEWAAMHPRTVVGDATCLPFDSQVFDAIATSPCYGNRMADHHDARDGSKRHTYRHYLGRQLHENSAGKLQWGAAYRDLHERAWAECYRVLVPFGVLILNISDHVRGGERMYVTDWHRRTLTELDFVLIDEIEIATPRLRHGENFGARVDHELVQVYLRRASAVAATVR